MKSFMLLGVGLSLLLSAVVFADGHIIASQQHTSAAVSHGGAGHTRVLIEHAKAALEYTLEASLSANGVAKSHLDAAAKELQECLDLASLGHIGAATLHAEAAERYIKASHK